jgi:6-phosphofructokinase 1
MMAFKRLSSTPYECEIITCGVSGVANAEKKFPLEWINKYGNDILPVALEYLTPLIEGEITYPTKNGLPVHFVF